MAKSPALSSASLHLPAAGAQTTGRAQLSKSPQRRTAAGECATPRAISTSDPSTDPNPTSQRCVPRVLSTSQLQLRRVCCAARCCCLSRERLVFATRALSVQWAVLGHCRVVWRAPRELRGRFRVALCTPLRFPPPTERRVVDSSCELLRSLDPSSRSVHSCKAPCRTL